jgi:uncharacterized protein (DUF885 family)
VKWRASRPRWKRPGCARTPRELLSYASYVSKKADWKLAETIGVLPRRRHGIRPVPEALAPIYTGGRGGLMGIYETPYEDFGRLTYEMWRACRLVIDTGLHQFGWTREQAMDYLRTHAALSEHEITTEIERYIAWPGQALAYKRGEMQIRRHRVEAEQALGARFDQRRFHDAILALGSVPLPVLEARMARFIADGGVNAPVAPEPTSAR